MNRELSKKEIILILVLAFFLLGLFYYQFVYKDIENKKAMYDTANIDDEILIEQTKLAQINKMKSEIEANKSNTSAGYVETYDNQKAEITALNDILSGAYTFNIGFDQAVSNDDAVRRNMNVTFSAASYSDAKKIITDLHDCKYRCLIRDLSITALNKQDAAAAVASAGESVSAEDTDDTKKTDTKDKTSKDKTTKDISTDTDDTASADDADTTQLSELDLNNGPVSVTLTVEFFETLYGSDTKDGLDIQDTQETTAADETAETQTQ